MSWLRRLLKLAETEMGFMFVFVGTVGVIVVILVASRNPIQKSQSTRDLPYLGAAIEVSGIRGQLNEMSREMHDILQQMSDANEQDWNATTQSLTRHRQRMDALELRVKEIERMVAE